MGAMLGKRGLVEMVQTEGDFLANQIQEASQKFTQVNDSGLFNFKYVLSL